MNDAIDIIYQNKHAFAYHNNLPEISSHKIHFFLQANIFIKQQN